MFRLKPAALALLLLACMSGPSIAADPAVPDTGMLTGKIYVPALDAICGGGKETGKGCAAVRARQIVDASTYPWSAIGRVNFSSIQISSHCTGTLIGRRLVLTAAHCLYNYWRKTWIPAQSIVFVAGYQKGTEVAASKATRYILPKALDASRRDFASYGFATDWALIELRDPIGIKAGYLGIELLDQASLDNALAGGAKLALSGYPAVRPHVQSLATDCGHGVISKMPDLVVQHCSAMFGDSGAPLLLIEGDKSTLIGTMSGFFVDHGRPFGTGPSPAAFGKAFLRAIKSDRVIEKSKPQILSVGKPPAR